MRRSVFVRQVLPAAAGYAALVLAALAADGALHRLGLASIGVWLGPLGTGLIALSFLYSLRKRKLLAAGSPKSLLRAHEVLTWLGSLAVLVHAGVHVNALLPWLAVAAMLVVVASGATGSVVLKRALQSQRPEGPLAVLDAVMVDAMKKWRAVHLPLNAVFLVLVLAHVASVALLYPW